jgi:hypothetical protein
MSPLANVIAISALFVAVTGNANAQTLKDARIVSQSGNWKVLRSVDPMKDTTSCTGIHKDNYAIQLTSTTLYIGVLGGLQSVTLRYGDKPARKLRLPEEMEKKLRSIIITGQDFAELSGSVRLRYQASTLVRGIETDEIDLVGFDEVLANIRSGCPIQEESSAPQKSVTPTGTLCTLILVKRMKLQSLRDDQIQTVCR